MNTNRGFRLTKIHWALPIVLNEKKLDPLAHHLLQVPPYVARLHEVICAENKNVLRMLKNVNQKRKY